MGSALKHPCDEESIRSARIEGPCTRKAGPWVLVGSLGAAFLIEDKR